MNQLNSLILEGNVVNDCVITEPKSGFMVCRFQMGVEHFYKNKENEMTKEISYFDIECYGIMAEELSPKIIKARGIRVVGRLKSEQFTDSENKTHNRIYVVAEHIEFKLGPINKTETKQEEENVCNKN